MKKIWITSILLTLFIGGVWAQRNPNTNASKIKNDTTTLNKSSVAADSLSQNNPFYSKTVGNTLQLGALLNYGAGINNEESLQNGFGFSFKIGYNPLKKASEMIATYVGLGFDYLYFGGKSIQQPNNVSLAINSNAYGWYPYLDLDIGRKDWPVVLFGNAYWGARFFYTRQNINYYDAQNVKQTNSKNIDGDVTQIYGLGGGVKLKLSNSIKLELKYQKNYGNYSKIINTNTIKFNSFGNLDSYENKNIDTDLNMFFMGLIICI